MRILILVAVAFISAAPTQTAPARVCESLSDVRLPDTTITAAQSITGGSFTPPGSTNAITNLPSFCRVAGVIKPTKDSHILFEVWLPLEKWNGKFAGVGNGGWAGNVSYGALAGQIRRGYAAASTNTGHAALPGEDMARFAFEHPEQLIDFAYRAHHETARKGKALARVFYARPPRYAYWVGCSSGGYEGLMEAQRFPRDYDGILAGAPANNWTRLMAGDLDAILAVARDPASHLPTPALELLNRAVLTACDSIDGVVDGVLDDPRRCTFDPAALTCSADQAPGACLASAQVEAARRVYRGLKDPMTGAQLYPGLAPGSELFWPNRNPANPFPIPIAHYKWLVFGDPAWDWRTFAFTDPAGYRAFLEGESKFARILNATDPNLREFRRRGGRLLQYHGWSDPLIAPQNSIDYYESVVSFFGGRKRDRNEALRDVQTFYRLYLAPGMAHCGNGPGPNSFDLQTALERWVEHGIAPEAVLATHTTKGVVDRSRPLCPYPNVALYSGKGDPNDAANFACSDPKRYSTTSNTED